MAASAGSRRTPSHRKTRAQSLSWALLSIYALWVAGLKMLAAHILPPVGVSFAEQLLLVAFFVAHALAYYSGGEVLFFAITNAIVSNLFENLSVMYGFPFGYYYHTIGPKLFNVPYVVTLIYMALGYISWMVAQVLLRRTSYGSWRRLAFVAPLVAAFVFTCWDLCIDPIYGTIYKAFIYRNPGVWFGTPGGNYFGWLLTTYVLYLPFSLYLRRHVAAAEKERVEASRAYWLQPVLLYFVIAIGIILTNVKGTSVDVVLANGKVWNAGDIYGASILVTLFTMVFISLLASLSWYQEQSSALAGSGKDMQIALRRPTAKSI